MFQLHFEVSEKDYFDFNKYHLLNSKSGKKSIRLYRWSLPIIFFALTIISIVNDGFTYGILVYLIGSILWLLFSPKILINSSKHNIKKLKKDGKLPYDSNGELVFTETEIFETTAHSEIKMNYEKIEKMCCADTFFYIYTDSARAFLLPHTAFESEEQKTAFIGFMKEKLGEDKIL